jgi:histidyl-tRNA synthetase
MIKAVRGTRDLLPPDTALWNFVESAARDVFRTYNFQEIRTPIFESTELFARGVGEETDIVSKEMFTWEDGSRAADYAVYKKWITTRMPAVAAFRQIDPNAAQPQSPIPQMSIRLDGKWNFIVFGYKLTSQALLELKIATERLDRNTHEFRLVTAEALPDNFRFLMGDVEVITERVSIDSSPQWITLRPENTAGVVRAYIEHKLWDRGLNKLYYIGPQFRRERPQKGRYRQFYQIGAEVIGPASAGSERPLRDAEVLEMLDTLLRRLGISDFTLEINSVGDAKDRAVYNDALRKALEPVVAKMCSDCQRRAVTNPLRVFDCKVPEDQPTIHTLPMIGSYLGPESKEHFENVQALLRHAGVVFEINPRLVRGLDYYTRTAFEFTHGALGAQNAILGGGRYDGLAELLGSPQPAPGIGFAIGEDRLVMALQERTSRITQAVDAYIAPVGEGMNRDALRLAKELRKEGLVIELGDRSFRLKKMFETATKTGAKYILIVGENEIKVDAFALKNLTTGEQVSVPRADLPQKIRD